MKENYNILIGALTSKPYAFTARSWELKNIETIDLFDSLCSNIRIDIRGSEILRILPLTNQFVNEEWISDKTRYAYDGLKRWRFINPMVKKKNLFINTSWQDTFIILKNKLQKNKFDKLIINTGNYCDLETITALDQFSKQFKDIVINSNTNIRADKQNYFILNKDFNYISGHKIYLLIGLNLRLENPIINIKFKKLTQLDNILITFIGSKYDYNFDLIHLGNNLITFFQILQGKHVFTSTMISFLKKEVSSYLYKNAISIIFGEECINQKNFDLITVGNRRVNFLNFDFKYLNSSSGKLNALELGFFNNKQIFINNKIPNIHYLIGTESSEYLKEDDFIIFQGHHNDKIRSKFDIILPSYNWYEKSSLYLNIYGFIQKTNSLLTPPQNTRTDWKIIRMISIIYNRDIGFNNIKEIHHRINELSPFITNSILKYNLSNKYMIKFKFNKKFYSKILVNLSPLKSYIPNYYKLNSLERSSKIMTNCSISLNNYKNNFYK